MQRLVWPGATLVILVLGTDAALAQDNTQAQLPSRILVSDSRTAPIQSVVPRIDATRPKLPGTPTPVPAPPLPPGESIEEAWERSGEGPRGLWTVEKLQKGIGTSVGLAAQCPPGTRAIGAGIENSSMTPFAMWQSHPKSNPPGWYILMHRNMVPPVGGGNPYPPTPYTFFMTVTCVDIEAWGRAMSHPAPP
jgi:hypothetical protein